MTPDELQRERIRQRLLMEAIRSGGPEALQGWARAPARADLARGVAVYVANAGMHAELALAARYPTVQALIGEEGFAQLARALWRAEPPTRGDLGQWGAGLAAFMAGDPQLADEPFLPDVARLDNAVSRAGGAPDRSPDLSTLMRLGDTDPGRLVLRGAPGAAVIASPQPVVSIWQAHHDPVLRLRPDRFDPVRQAWAESRGETAWVWRREWAVHVAAIDAVTAAFNQLALVEAWPLGPALDRMAASAATADFSFETWLARAAAEQWLLGADVLALEGPPC